jgi:hypothetical protein
MAKDLVKRIPRKFILYFYDIYSIFYEFYKLIEFPEIQIGNRNLEKKNEQHLGRNRPEATACWLGPAASLACAARLRVA